LDIRNPAMTARIAAEPDVCQCATIRSELGVAECGEVRRPLGLLDVFAWLQQYPCREQETRKCQNDNYGTDDPSPIVAVVDTGSDPKRGTDDDGTLERKIEPPAIPNASGCPPNAH
jgi:hypothetical protein